MTGLSAFAAEATLPAAVLVALCLAVGGRRGACMAWMAAVGGWVAVLLLLRGGLDILVCLGGSDDLIRPAGPVAAATLAYGGLVVLLLHGRHRRARDVTRFVAERPRQGTGSLDRQNICEYYRCSVGLGK